MRTINNVTKTNLKDMFNLKEILKESVFYPASGIDNTVIKCLSNQYSSFIYADYSISQREVYHELFLQLENEDCQLIGLHQIPLEELSPNNFNTDHFVLNEHESQRMENVQISESFHYHNFNPFVFWAVYELNQLEVENIIKEPKRFSLLYIGAEACATFDTLYLNNKINPLVIAIINPAEGFGDNWTLFRDPDFRLHTNLTNNYLNNNTPMPSKIITNMNISEHENDCFWPGYRFDGKCYLHDTLDIYSRI